MKVICMELKINKLFLLIYHHKVISSKFKFDLKPILLPYLYSNSDLSLSLLSNKQHKRPCLILTLKKHWASWNKLDVLLIKIRPKWRIEPVMSEMRIVFLRKPPGSQIFSYLTFHGFDSRSRFDKIKIYVPKQVLWGSVRMYSNIIPSPTISR